MSITSELRDFVDELACHKSTRDMLREIADRIDQEHEECAGFCHRLEDTASKGEEVTIFGTDYVPLPKDADGVIIRIGDRLNGYNKTIEVVELRYGRCGWVLISRDGNGYDNASAFVHHRPTVEDVLRAFWSDVDLERADGCGDFSPIIAEYAAKLRLAGEDA